MAYAVHCDQRAHTHGATAGLNKAQVCLKILPPTWRIIPLCLFWFHFLTCCLSKCSLSAPRLASTRLLFTRVGTCLMLFILLVLHDELFQRELIHRFYRKKQRGETHIYHGVSSSSSSFSPDSGLSVCVCHRQASPHGGFITRWCVAAEGGRANERVRLVLRVRILPQGGGNHHHHHHHRVLCEPTSSLTARQHYLHLSHFWYDKCVFVVCFFLNQHLVLLRLLSRLRTVTSPQWNH